MEQKGDSGRPGEFIPTPETENEPFQVDKYGNFRIIVKGRPSCWTDPGEMAGMMIGGIIYIGITDNFRGGTPCLTIPNNSTQFRTLPTRCILKVEQVDDDGLTDFYQFKIVDTIENRVLDKDDIDDILRDPMYDEDYDVKVIASRRKDYVKIKIIGFATLCSDEKNRILEEDDVIKFVVEAFNPSETDIYNIKGDIINK